MSSNLSRAVSADLSTIFPGAAPAPAADAIPIAPITEPNRRRDVLTMAGAALAIGLVGVVAGWLVARPASAPEPRLRTAEPPAVVLTAPAPLPATPLPLPLPAPEPPRVTAPSPMSHASIPTARQGQGLTARCGRLARGERSWCAHRVVMSQDRDLRRAYAKAVRAGVPRAALSGYTRRWAALRGQATAHPERVASGYAAMSRELTRRAQGRGPARRR